MTSTIKYETSCDYVHLTDHTLIKHNKLNFADNILITFDQLNKHQDQHP